MSPLEKEALTLIFDGADSSHFKVLVDFLNLQAKKKLNYYDGNLYNHL
jgi:hypothetical protein